MPSRPRKLLDQVRDTLRLKHCSYLSNVNYLGLLASKNKFGTSLGRFSRSMPISGA
jgi:hypothetical protein